MVRGRNLRRTCPLTLTGSASLVLKNSLGVLAPSVAEDWESCTDDGVVESDGVPDEVPDAVVVQ